ncbi:MAG TPA: TIGR03560 family F420-dependent LLM class oxidoreductase [Ardenticatenaceae bacterium]|nr:TIGR03560 family F420-dependent LLM class oxidoreductase [Ardenticatenaceae bacterium]
MIEVAIMIEGQNGLNWPRWQRIAQAVEDLGFAGLYRSDHFTNADPPDIESLELWVSLTWLASHTRRIEFGPLVTPFSFRHPVHTARVASQVDDLSDGRLTLGLGAGWQEREHDHFGFDLLEPRQRFARFEEGLEVVTRLLRGDEPVSFDGEFYQLRDAILLPRPQRPGGPPILIGGNGPTRTPTFVARYASEWNGVFLTPSRYAQLSRRLDEVLEQHGRQPRDVRRSLMTYCAFGRDEQELRGKLDGRDAAEMREQGLVVGTAAQIIEQLGRLDEAGVQRVMLQWLDLDDLDGLEAMASTVLPQV